MGKKIYRRLGILILILSAMAIFTGCQPARVHTQTDIKKDLSGERVITVNIEKSTVSEYYDGTMQQISQVIDAACPEELTWSYAEEGTAYELQFVLAFSSIDDYNTKVHKIMTGETYKETDEPWVEFEDTDTFWKKKFYFEEDFTSIELLKWLKDALVKEGIVSQRDSAYIFSNGENYIKYNNNQYSTYEYAYVEDKEFVPYKRIEIRTIANEDGTYDRDVLFVLEWDRAASVSYEELVKEAMAEFVPEGATTAWEMNEEEGEQSFRISKENMDVEAVNAFMAHCFGETGTKFNVLEQTGYFVRFTLQKKYEETVNFVRFYDKDMKFGPEVVYYIQSEDGYTLLGNDKATNAKGVSAMSSNKSFSVTFQRVFSATNVQVVTNVLGDDEFERTTKIAFDKAPMGTDLLKIEKNINRLFGGFVSATMYGDGTIEKITIDDSSYEYDLEEIQDIAAWKEMLKVEIIAEEIDGVLVYTLIQRGSSEDIKNSDIYMLGQSGNISYGTSTKGLRLKNETGFSQSVNLSRLITQMTDTCSIEYIIVLPGGSKVDFCNIAGYDAKGKQVTINTTLKTMDVSVVAKRINGWYMGFLFFMLVVLAGIVLLVQKYGLFQKAVVMIKDYVETAKNHEEEEPEEQMQKQTFAFTPQALKKKTESVIKSDNKNIVVNEGEEGIEKEQEVIEISEENLENLDIEIDL